MEKNPENLIWIDLEMTGLDTTADEIIEIATIVTNKNLDEWVEGPSLVIYQSDEVLDKMDDWNQNQHSKSGLIEEVRGSLVNCIEAEQETLKFLAQYISPGESPMCGQSICQDRRFLARLMPQLESFFHYRNLDVSSISELVQRWMPGKLLQEHKSSDEMEMGKKRVTHRAMEDVRQAIRKLQHYKKCVFMISDS